MIFLPLPKGRKEEKGEANASPFSFKLYLLAGLVVSFVGMFVFLKKSRTCTAVFGLFQRK
ncbi:hypothetical protein [Nibribacter koreensis]|uniref:hypothetical protein n=1 Tax=Nibribacter koreensis TaxID=1084519 RepID=UPI0031EE36DC